MARGEILLKYKAKKKKKADYVSLLLSTLQWFLALFWIKIKILSMAPRGPTKFFPSLPLWAHPSLIHLTPITLASYHFLWDTKKALLWALHLLFPLPEMLFLPPLPLLYPHWLNPCFIFISALMLLHPNGLPQSLFKITSSGLTWWSSGSDSTFPVQGPKVQSLVRELDLTCHS